MAINMTYFQSRLARIFNSRQGTEVSARAVSNDETWLISWLFLRVSYRLVATLCCWNCNNWMMKTWVARINASLEGHRLIRAMSFLALFESLGRSFHIGMRMYGCVFHCELSSKLSCDDAEQIKQINYSKLSIRVCCVECDWVNTFLTTSSAEAHSTTHHTERTFRIQSRLVMIRPISNMNTHYI